VSSSPVATSPLTPGTPAGFSPRAPQRSRLWLHRSTAAWLAVAAAGQLLFGIYVAVFYGGAAWQGDMARWSKIMPRGWIPGDHLGNTAIAVHFAVALVICLVGFAQLLPAIRRTAPSVHRWMGRAFVTSAVLGATSGFWMQWIRGGTSAMAQRLGTTTNGVVILICAGLAWQAARQRNCGRHRRWALRLFLASNGVWFFRIGLMFTLMVFGRPVGFDPETFRGPLLVGLAWAETVIPLAVLEVWLRAERSPSQAARALMAGVMFLLAAATGIGVTGAAMMLWLPNLR
jgi:uncharacterized membrane protein